MHAHTLHIYAKVFIVVTETCSIAYTVVVVVSPLFYVVVTGIRAVQ
jgi:hypothetical protein